MATMSVTRNGHTVYLYCGCGRQVNTADHLNSLPASAFGYWYTLPVCNTCHDAGKRPTK